MSVVGYTLHGNRYLNITNRCNLRCAFCPKFNGDWDVQGYGLRLRRQPSLKVILEAAADPSQYKEVVLCGLGEPTLRLDVLLAVSDWVQEQGGRVRINTDGLANLAHGRDITPRFAGRVDALSISLNAQDEVTYIRHCRPQQPGSYQSLLDFVRCARDHVPAVTLTAIDGLPGVDVEACKRIADGLGVGFRRRVLDRVG